MIAWGLLFVAFVGTEGDVPRDAAAFAQKLREGVSAGGEFPYQVSVRSARTNEHVCSGALIARRWVLTSASCTTQEASFKVAAGSDKLSEQDEESESERLIHHEGYVDKKRGNDIAVVRLRRDVRAEAAVLPWTGVRLRNESKITGWSNVDVTGSLAAYDNVTLWKSECNRLFHFLDVLRDDEFCGEYPVRPGNATPGPGSLVSKNGVVYGFQTDSHPQFGMQAFTEISRHASWISDKLGADSSSLKWHTERAEKSSSAGLAAARLLPALPLLLLTAASAKLFANI